MYKISVSKAKTFESCKKKFKFNYILKLKQKEFLFFDYGKMLHMVLEDFHRALMLDPNLNKSKVMGKCFKEARKKYGGKLSEDDIKEAYRTIDEYLQILANEQTPAEILDVEKEFKVEIEGVVSLIGMIDRVQKDPDGVLHVLDYKTSKNMKYYEEDFFQMLTYAYVMLLEDPSLKTIRCSYMFLRHGFKCITKEFGPEDILVMGKEFVDYAAAMQSEKEFPANPNFLCNYCGFLPHCVEGLASTMPKIKKNGETSWT
jgi:putative RecB family exonuclease